MASIPAHVLERAQRVSLLVLDVDGVLTDGRIIYDEFGDELKCFDVHDGAGLALWHRAGLKSAVITSRTSRLVKRRARELKVDFLAQGSPDKRAAFEQALKRLRMSPEQSCVVGDDLMELPLLRRAGLAVAVANAVEEVKASSHYVTQRAGGRGAVREVIEIILHAKGLWQEATEHFSP